MYNIFDFTFKLTTSFNSGHIALGSQNTFFEQFYCALLKAINLRKENEESIAK